MPLSINFRWKTPNVQAQRPDPNGMGQGMENVAEAIANMKQSRYMKEQQARRNAIEDEDRRNAADEKERMRHLYGETADLIRGRSAEREQLVKQREAIVAQINELKARLGL